MLEGTAEAKGATTIDTMKIRVKVRDNEFDAEGPTEAVQAQFEAWKALVATQPPTGIIPSQFVAPDGGRSRAGEEDGGEAGDRAEVPLARFDRDHLMRVFHADDRRSLVSLRVPVNTERRHADAAVLILFGFRELRGEDEVTTQRLMNALGISGFTADRLDRPLAPYVRDGLILQAGTRKGTRYRLTNTGVTKAEELLAPLMAQLPR
jgi:hypothetical protein